MEWAAILVRLSLMSRLHPLTTLGKGLVTIEHFVLRQQFDFEQATRLLHHANIKCKSENRTTC